jgi:deuterolysin
VTGTEITGSIPFDSNELTITVDGAEAAKVAHVGHLAARTRIASCSGSRSSSLQTALRNTVTLATNAANAALQGGTRFTRFFKTDSSSTRNAVAARFRAIASEASSTSSGATTYYCQDPYGYCSPNVLAYALPASNIIANCDIYYSGLPAVTGSCYAQDQVGTTLHEFTHTPGVYSPGTQDYAYGYSASTALSASQALNNADSYALFANGMCSSFTRFRLLYLLGVANTYISCLPRLLKGKPLSPGWSLALAAAVVGMDDGCASLGERLDTLLSTIFVHSSDST